MALFPLRLNQRIGEEEELQVRLTHNEFMKLNKFHP